MKTVEELKQYFTQDLAADIAVLEKQRKAIITRVVLMVLLMLAVYIAACVFILMHETLSGGFIVLFSLVIPTLGFVWYKEITSNTKFYTQFKLSVINKIVHFIDSSFNYNPKKFVLPVRFVESKLFNHIPTKYVGDDYVWGDLEGGAHVEFSEIHAQYKLPKDQQGKGKKELEDIFKGLFFVATTQNHFKGTVIFPKGHSYDPAALSLPSSFGKINVDNAEFSDLFDVYSIDPAEAADLLNDRDVCKDFIEFRKTNPHNELFSSFFGNHVYAGVTFQKDLFEPRLYHSMLDFSIIKEYYDVLYTAMDIIEHISSHTDSRARTRA